MLQHFRAKVIKRGNNFFLKTLTHSRVFSLLLSHSPGKRGFLWSGNQTFPITSATLLCNVRGNRVWYRDNQGEHLSWHRPLGASIGARESLTSATWEKWSRPKDFWKSISLILIINKVPALVLHVVALH